MARSDACENQAFVYGQRVLGLQFHLESTNASVADIVANCADELVPGQYVQDAERMLNATEGDFARVNRAMFGILNRLGE